MQENQSEDGWRGFLNLCLKVGGKKQLHDLLVLMTTEEERKDLAARYLIVKGLIQKKKTQRELAKELKVSIANITRGSNFLKTIGADLIQYLEETFK